MYTLNGVLGQADTGTLSGGDYSPRGDFFGDGNTDNTTYDNVYLPLMQE